MKLVTYNPAGAKAPTRLIVDGHKLPGGVEVEVSDAVAKQAERSGYDVSVKDTPEKTSSGRSSGATDTDTKE